MIATDERLRRWRLVLGADAEGSCGGLDGRDARMDAALAALYGGAKRQGGGGGGNRGASNQPRSAADSASAWTSLTTAAESR